MYHHCPRAGSQEQGFSYVRNFLKDLYPGTRRNVGDLFIRIFSDLKQSRILRVIFSGKQYAVIAITAEKNFLLCIIPSCRGRGLLYVIRHRDLYLPTSLYHTYLHTISKLLETHVHTLMDVLCLFAPRSSVLCTSAIHHLFIPHLPIHHYQSLSHVLPLPPLITGKSYEIAKLQGHQKSKAGLGVLQFSWKKMTS